MNGSVSPVLGRPLAWLIALVSGAAGMTVEVAAVRLLAPWFGTSVYVWTNVIGVTLFALALGAWVGGILAERARPRRSLRAVLAFGGLLALAVPFVCPWLAAATLPADLRLEEAAPILTFASLATALTVFAPPIFLVGAVTPLLVKLRTEAGSSVGRGSGNVWALSTLGSLLGTFGTTHLFVPYLGAPETIAGAGGLLLALGALPERVPGGTRTAAVVALLCTGGTGVLTAFAAPPNHGPMPTGARLLAVRETPYQFARVIEFDGEDRHGAFRERHLQVNEGLDSFQSFAREGRVFTGAYYDPLAFTTLFLERGQRPWRILVIGLGAGTVVPILRALAAPLDVDLDIVGVEIDPGVVELSEWLDFQGEGLRSVQVHAGIDGRVALRHLMPPWDLVLVDAYASQVHIPAHLASLEFFSLVRRRLAPDGLVALNVGRMHERDPVPEAIASTLAVAFGQAFTWPVLENRNVILFAGEDLDLDVVRRRAHERSAILGEPPDGPFAERLRALDEHLRFPGVVALTQVGEGVVLEDARPLLDVLQWRALRLTGENP